MMTIGKRLPSILRTTFVLLLSALVLLYGGCAGWRTTHSAKFDESNAILVNLNLFGDIGIGHSGPGREIVDGYMFSQSPIKREYLDDEIKMSRTTTDNYAVIRPIKGSLSFNADYTTVTMNIQIQKEGVFVDFPGNGTHRMNDGR